METIDLSNEPLPERTTDREFDQRFIGDAAKYLKDIRDNSKDYVTPVTAMEVKQNGNKWNMWLGFDGGLLAFNPTPWARNQTIGVTELPKRYHDTLTERGHVDEAVKHLNMWLHEDPNKKFQVRTVADDYRALVSPGYNAFDNYDMFITTANAIKSANLMRDDTTKPITYYKSQVSDQNLYLHLIDEGREWDLGKGDTYKPMIVIKNSEVGDGAMRVDAGLWRSMCSNLMLHGVISRRVHMGERLSEGIWSPETRIAQNELWKGILRDSINAGVASDELFQPMLDEIRETKEIKVEPLEAVAKIKKAVKLTDAEEGDIISMMMGDRTIIEDDRNTLFAVTNGMTQAAKNFGIERGNEVMRIAGDMKTLIKVVA